MTVDRRRSSEEAEDHEADRYLAMGATVGVIGAASAAIGAAVCPVCVVVAPTLLGVGVYKKWRERRARDGG